MSSRSCHKLALQAAFTAALVFAQSSSSHQPTIKADVREVVVPVVVTDKLGGYPTGLDRTEFSVFENGKPQRITSFTKPPALSAQTQIAPPSLGRATEPAPVASASEIPKHTYLICLDSLHMAFNHFAQVRQALTDFFAHEESGSDSQYVLIAIGRQLHVLVDSTRDPATIMAAINSKALLKTIQDSESANIANETNRFAALVSHWCGACSCQSVERDMDRQLCPLLKAEVKAALFSFSERMAICNQSFLQQLKQAVSAMSTMPTRRTILFISDGFHRFPGEEFYTIVRSAGVGDSSLDFNPRDLQPQLEAVLKLATNHDVRFYTIDSRGLYTGAEVPGAGQDPSSRGTSQQIGREEMTAAWFNGDAMSQLARQTGGQFLENSNNLLKGIRRAFQDEREEYILAYSPSNTKLDGKFRHITVKVKQSDLQVAAKRGYWASP